MGHSRVPRRLRHPGADANCDLCAGRGYGASRDGELAVATVCPCVGRCPRCVGTGFVAASTEHRAPRRRCHCQVVLARLRAFDNIGIPARHAESSRANFVPQTREQTAVLGVVSKYLAAYCPGQENRGLVLHGDVGRGKTHVMVALLRELVMRHGVTAKFVEFSHLLADLKSGFDVGRGVSAVLDPLVQVDVLGIDELGKGRNTEFEGTVVDELVSRRYNAARPILATTNYGPTAATRRRTGNAAAVALKTEAPLALIDRIGDRVFSRLCETCDFVPLTGEDYRERRRGRRDKVV